MQAVLKDWRTAPISDKLKAMLAYLEKLTTHPDDVQPQDVEPLHCLGIQDQAIVEAIYVCVVFNIIDRLADALDFRIPPTFVNWKSAKMYRKLGYKFPIDSSLGG